MAVSEKYGDVLSVVYILGCYMGDSSIVGSVSGSLHEGSQCCLLRGSFTWVSLQQEPYYILGVYVKAPGFGKLASGQSLGLRVWPASLEIL